MKWNQKRRYNDTRTVTGFLWFPRKIGFETRWLEVASWTQGWWVDGRGRWGSCWEDIAWVKTTHVYQDRLDALSDKIHTDDKRGV